MTNDHATDHAPDHVLVISHLAKAYRPRGGDRDARVRVLRDVSLSLRERDFITIAGPPGAGKTTLLLCASGLLRPDLGTVTWPAFRSARPPAEVAYVGMRAPMYAFLTVRESLAYAATVRELHVPNSTCASDEILEQVDLVPYASTRVGLLDRAQQARFTLGLSLISRPRLLLVDDLTAGQSAPVHASFAGALAALASSGIAVAWATHPAIAFAGVTASYALADGWLKVAAPAVMDDTAPWIPYREPAAPALGVAERPPRGD